MTQPHEHAYRGCEWCGEGAYTAQQNVLLVNALTSKIGFRYNLRCVQATVRS